MLHLGIHYVDSCQHQHRLPYWSNMTYHLMPFHGTSFDRSHFRSFFKVVLSLSTHHLVVGMKYVTVHLGVYSSYLCLHQCRQTNIMMAPRHMPIRGSASYPRTCISSFNTMRSMNTHHLVAETKCVARIYVFVALSRLTSP